MKVLFVCSGNAYRSPLAEALLKKLRSDLDVDSAGLHVVIPVSSEVKSFLKKLDAAQHLKRYSESLDEKNLRGYDLIVAMEQKHKAAVLRRCSECADKIVVWNIEDPYFEEREVEGRIYAEIQVKVKELAESL